MANVIPSLIQASQYQQEAANRGIQQVADFLKQKKIRQLGQAFVQQGDYTPEGIQKFAQQNNLSPQDMGGIVQVASAFEDFKRQREHDALQKQQYADKQRYYADQLALEKDKLEYDKSRLTQNDQAAQAKAANQAQKDKRKIISDKYNINMKMLAKKDAGDYAFGLDTGTTAQNPYELLKWYIAGDDPELAGLAKETLGYYRMLTGFDPSKYKRPEHDGVGLLNMGAFQGGVQGKTPRQEQDNTEQVSPPKKQVTVDGGKTVTAVKAPDGKYYYEENGKFYLVEGE